MRHAVALDHAGKKLFGRGNANDGTKPRDTLAAMAKRRHILLVVEEASTISALLGKSPSYRRDQDWRWTGP